MSAPKFGVGHYVTAIETGGGVECGRQYRINKVSESHAGSRYSAPGWEYFYEVTDLASGSMQPGVAEGRFEYTFKGSEPVQRAGSKRLAGALPRHKLLLLERRS